MGADELSRDMMPPGEVIRVIELLEILDSAAR